MPWSNSFRFVQSIWARGSCEPRVGRDQGPRSCPMAGISGSGLGPCSRHVKAFAGHQRRYLVKRQADDIAVGTDELLHESAGNALDGIGTGLAAPLARRNVVFDLAR